MSGEYKFLKKYEKCPICGDKLIHELLVSFGAVANNWSHYKITIPYIQDFDNKKFRFVKFKTDDERGYNKDFDRAPVDIFITGRGLNISNSSFILNSYYLFSYCSVVPTFYVETKEIFPSGSNSKLIIRREEILVDEFRIINDYENEYTKVYSYDKHYDIESFKFQVKLMDITNTKTVVDKIKSLMVLI